jgi:hypothetical protein
VELRVSRLRHPQAALRPQMRRSQTRRYICKNSAISIFREIGYIPFRAAAAA